MSGYKRATVTISEEEYRRLHQADMKQRFRERSQQKAQQRKPSGEWAQAVQQLEARQQELDQALLDLVVEVEEADSELLQEIRAQNSLYYESLTTLIEEHTSGAHAALEELSQRVHEEMQRERERRRSELDLIRQQMYTLHERELSKESVARHWLRRAVTVADFLREQYDHNRFCPGRLARIEQNLELAQQNLAQGLSEASLQFSQQAFLDLSDLHMELEQHLVEWHAEFEATRGALQQALTEIELTASIPALGLQGEELPEQVDLAYWSRGKYGRLRETARQFLSLLDQDQQRITKEELKRVRTELLPILQESFESLIYEARMHALNSQLRMNIAEQALRALETQGFVLSEAGYVDKDMRASFLAQLRNADGSQVTIEVVPTQQAEQELTNELVVITRHPFLKTEHEARLQWEELARSLAEYDLKVSRPAIRAAPPPPAPAGTVEQSQPAERERKVVTGAHHVR
jgi:hypothetical protein